MEGALLIAFAIVSTSTGIMFIWVADGFDMGAVFEKAMTFVDGPTNAFAAFERMSASAKLLNVFIFLIKISEVAWLCCFKLCR